MSRHLKTLEATYKNSIERSFVSSFKLSLFDNSDNISKYFDNNYHKIEHEFDFFQRLYEYNFPDIVFNGNTMEFIISIDNNYDEALNFHNNSNDFFNKMFVHEFILAKNKFILPKNNQIFSFAKTQESEKKKKENNSIKQYKIPDNIFSILNAIKELSYKKYNTKRQYEIITQKLIVKLKIDYELQYREITQLLGVTINNIKNALKNHKNGCLTELFIDNRGVYKKRTAKRTQHLYAQVENYIDNNKYIDIRNIASYLRSLPDPNWCSFSTIKRIIKTELYAQYRTLTIVSQYKNTEKHKIYRKFATIKILKTLNSEDILISLDETSFASTSNKHKSWTILKSKFNYAPKKTKNYSSITLLMALSVEAVEGYYIISGSSNQIFFCLFLIDLVDKIKQKYTDKNKRILILLDNLYSHRTLLIQKVAKYLNIQLLFNCPYTPETNFIENSFCYLKREFKRNMSINNQ